MQTKIDRSNWKLGSNQFTFLAQWFLLTKQAYRGKRDFCSNNLIVGKAHEYWVKIYELVATNGDTWNSIVYTDKQDASVDLEHAQTVILDLADSLSERHRTDTSFIWTLRSTRAGSGHAVDQLLAYYTCLRRSKKCHHKVAFEMISGVYIVNAYSIYKECYTLKKKLFSRTPQKGSVDIKKLPGELKCRKKQ